MNSNTYSNKIQHLQQPPFWPPRALSALPCWSRRRFETPTTPTTSNTLLEHAVEKTPLGGFSPNLLLEWMLDSTGMLEVPTSTPVRIERKPEYDSSAGVIVTEAGRRLGL